MTKEDIKSKGIPCDTLSKYKGAYTLRKSFFWKDSSSIEISEKLKDNFQNFDILDTWDKYVPFRGGDTIKEGSHYGVKFIVK